MNWPNRLTILRVCLIPVCVWLMHVDSAVARVLAPAVFIVACLSDWLDGWLARRQHIVTNFGKFLDPVADKLLVLSVLVALCGLGRVPSWTCIVILFRELAVDGLRLIAVEQGRVIAAGPLGKLKTATQMCALTAYLCGLDVVGWVLLLLAVALTVWSGVDYFIRNRGALTGGGKGEAA